MLRGVESILTTINSEGAVESGSEDPIVPFSQFELTLVIFLSSRFSFYHLIAPDKYLNQYLGHDFAIYLYF